MDDLTAERFWPLTPPPPARWMPWWWDTPERRRRRQVLVDALSPRRQRDEEVA